MAVSDPEHRADQGWVPVVEFDVDMDFFVPISDRGAGCAALSEYPLREGYVEEVALLVSLRLHSSQRIASSSPTVDLEQVVPIAPPRGLYTSDPGLNESLWNPALVRDRRDEIFAHLLHVLARSTEDYPPDAVRLLDELLAWYQDGPPPMPA